MKKLTPEELKQYRKEYYLKNKEKIKAYYKAWAKVNRPKTKTTPSSGKYEKYKDKIKAYYWKKKAERELAESLETKPKKQLSRWLMESE